MKRVILPHEPIMDCPYCNGQVMFDTYACDQCFVVFEICPTCNGDGLIDGCECPDCVDGLSMNLEASIKRGKQLSTLRKNLPGPN